MTNRLFCFGLGYSALILARALAAAGWEIAGTVRTPEKAVQLKALGFKAHVFGPQFVPPLETLGLDRATHILSSVDPGRQGDPVVSTYGDAIGALGATCRWIGYLSTTGVYGDRGGDWVDEDTPIDPSGPRGERRMAAERAWTELGAQSGIPVHIFRLASIYGPGRNPLVALRAGKARRIVKEGQVFSRIHVTDIAQVVAASMARPRAGAIYNVCDDEAAPPHEVVTYAAELLGVAPPPLERFEDAAPSMTPMARSFYRDSKRVRNERIKRELGVTLRYPSYREGLRALLEANQVASSPPGQ